MIKSETDTAQHSQQMRDRQTRAAHGQDRQPERTQARAEHDEHAQKGG